MGLTVDVTYDPASSAAFSIEATTNGGADTSFVKGTVSPLVLASSSVSIASDAGTVSLIVDAATEIQVNNVGGTLEDLQLAMPIQAEYDTATLHAKSITAGNGDDNHELRN